MRKMSPTSAARRACVTGAVAAAMAVAAAFACSAPSEAAVPRAIACASEYHPVQSPDGGALACFNPTGEHLYVCDNAADGHHPGVNYFITGGSWKNAQYDLGNGACHDLNLDIAESDDITYQACNYEGSTALSCSVYETVSARG
ncbi:hypothetical protein POF50_001930 [Streptomyces sp. SL13]|jgi:hypothetical protein|uniref:Secreted protein n=1 Tax=Streptantibioticus silvisoli TaxID=2705255 RepID=A0AA90H0Y6_9ACTN|nr:hypothetical protein [Streptantibioticus silvisoli]MDI5968117.1 hypothetical protein [Streptantibioticus silvisoli]